MSQLTLSQRSTMAGNGYFHQRLSSAIRKTANYWLNYAMDSVAKYNKAVQKRKLLARQIMQGMLPVGMQAYAEYLLSQYNENTPDLIGGNGIDAGQVSDAVLTDSSASTLTYDFFAGVETGDDTRAVTF